MSACPERHCADDRERRRLVRASPLNGLDYLEVSDDQRHLTVYFLGKAPDWLTARHLQIRGGRRIRDLRVVALKVRRSSEPDEDDCVTLTVDRPGDASTYTLCVVALDEAGRPTDTPPADIDPRYACVCFSFKAGCPSDLDCLDRPAAPAPVRPSPAIDYLAKDYASFRRLMLDRLALVMPDWKERHVPDLGITLVELLAYVGDHLSYYQDAVATEAYLDTARQRISVRRHVRLVDYFLHEGCNARAWVHVALSGHSTLRLPLDDVYFTTAVGGQSRDMRRDEEMRNLPPDACLVFEPLRLHAAPDVDIHTAHNEIRFYTWQEARCSLPKGSTSATLVDPVASSSSKAHDEGGLHLTRCDVLVLEEVKGPTTGHPADADPTHRHAVRLTDVRRSLDPLTGQRLVEVEWGIDDALPFPLCISSVSAAPECRPIEDVSVARGNILLVDHGQRVSDELGQVPTGAVTAACDDGCEGPLVQTRPGPFRPRLLHANLTHTEPVPLCERPADGCVPRADVVAANALLGQQPRLALPWLTLHSSPPAPAGAPTSTASDSSRTWIPRRDLLASGPDDRHVVVEIDDTRTAYVRFGDGDAGRRPDAGASVRAEYRVGNGSMGNVGADAITTMVWRTGFPDGIDLRVRNPLPAAGGQEPEPVAQARLRAPHVFRSRLERAITADDYAAIVMRDFAAQVQRAAAIMRWNGVVPQVQVAVDVRGRAEPDPDLLCQVERHLQAFRRMGHDLHVTAAHAVPLDVGITVCVDSHYTRGQVAAVLLDVFGNRMLSDGRRGMFHPDSLTFGQSIHASRMIATAQAVPGVNSVYIHRLERLFEGPQGELESGVLRLGPLEVARLDNDPSLPENGRLALTLEGGR